MDQDQIRAASSVRSAINRVGTITGSAIGGLVVGTFGIRWGLLIDLGTFAINFLVLLTIYDPSSSTLSDKSVWGDAMAGIRYVLSVQWVGAIMLQGLIQVAFVVAPVTVLLPLLFGSSHASLYGLAVAGDAVGAFIGSLIGAGLRSSRQGLYALLALMAQMPQLLVIACHLNILLLLPFGLFTGLGMSIFGVAWTTALQLTTPRDKLGRVFTLDALSNSALLPVGLVLTGFLLPIWGTRVIAWGATIILPLSVLLTLLVPGVVKFDGSGLDGNASTPTAQ